SAPGAAAARFDHHHADITARGDDLHPPHEPAVHFGPLHRQHAPPRFPLRHGSRLVAADVGPGRHAGKGQQRGAEEDTDRFHGFVSLSKNQLRWYSRSSSGVTDTRTGRLWPGCSRITVWYWLPRYS